MCQAPCQARGFMARKPQSFTSSCLWNLGQISTEGTGTNCHTESKTPAERGFDSKSQKSLELTFSSGTCLPFHKAVHSCFSFPKEPKGRQPSARDLCQPLPCQDLGKEAASIWVKEGVGSVGCPCDAHFAMSCGGGRKIKTDGNYTSPSAKMSRWSR